MISTAFHFARCGTSFGRRLLITHRYCFAFNQRDEKITRSSKLLYNAQSLFSTEKIQANVAIKESTCDSNIFPHPTVSLHNLSNEIVSKLKKPPIFSERFRREKNVFVCEIKLTWPEIRMFSGDGKRKMIAKTKACVAALEWLYSNNYITKDSKAILSDIANTRNNITVDFDQLTQDRIDSVLKFHSEEIVPALSGLTAASTTQSRFLQSEKTHPTLGVPFPSPESLQLLSRTLQEESNHRPHRKTLPIDDYRQNILGSLKTSRVVIVKGETGCGKTTRIPQFILDDAVAEGHGAFCNIAVIQPRRLTAVEIAKHVAKERGEKVGMSVGYSVKMATKRPSVIGGSITFMTGMKFALKFAQDSSLPGISHVIMDEVHLRDVGTDLSLAMDVNQNLRVIIMSATVETSIFQSYFASFGHIPVINVPGRTFPVKMHFEEDLPSSIYLQNKIQVEKMQGNRTVDFDVVTEVVSWINNKKPEGAILIFVSGWSEMAELQRRLSKKKDLLIVSMHSMFKDCSAAFEPAPTGQRKVILATNIAETSFTFPDVVYVIDCGMHKKPYRNLLSPGGWSSTKMGVEWISKANVFQRSGRAGRVQPGESFHLFSKETFNQMEDHTLPGILSESLEYLVLSVKMINPNVKAAELLKQFPTEPSEQDVKQAVRSLQKASLLTRRDEKPTPLALAVMGVSSSLPSALALVYSAIFRCFDSTLSVIACEEAPLIIGSEEDKSSGFQRSFKESYHASSDHLAKGKAIDSKMLMHPHPSYFQARALKKFLSKQIVSMSTSFVDANLSKHNNEELVLGILLNCFGSLLVKSHSKSLHIFLRERSGYTAIINARSMNSKRSADPFALYLSGSFSKDTNLLSVSDTSVISPLSVLLFLPSDFKAIDADSESLLVSAWRGTTVHVAISKEHYHRIIGLRKALKDVQEYFITAEVLNQPDEHLEVLCQFREQLIECLSDILQRNRMS